MILIYDEKNVVNFWLNILKKKEKKKKNLIFGKQKKEFFIKIYRIFYSNSKQLSFKLNYEF